MDGLKAVERGLAAGGFAPVRHGDRVLVQVESESGHMALAFVIEAGESCRAAAERWQSEANRYAAFDDENTSWGPDTEVEVASFMASVSDALEILLRQAGLEQES